MKISVVVPVLNERVALPRTLEALERCRGIDELIVVDGGSTDGTLEWLQSQTGILLVSSPRGKGIQLNGGAAKAGGDLILFLHADCALEQIALDQLRAAMSDAQFAGGGFCIRFAESRPRSLRLVAAGINLRARARRTATGDQGIFVRKKVFDAIGGAPEWPLFEDVELVRRIKTAGKFAILRTPLTISARRYIEHGVFRTAVLIYTLRFAYWLGVSPQRLKLWFRDTRSADEMNV